MMWFLALVALLIVVTVLAFPTGWQRILRWVARGLLALGALALVALVISVFSATRPPQRAPVTHDWSQPTLGVQPWSDRCRSAEDRDCPHNDFSYLERPAPAGSRPADPLANAVRLEQDTCPDGTVITLPPGFELESCTAARVPLRGTR